MEIKNTEVAKVLTDLTQVRLLEPFFNDITLSDAAKQLEVKLTTLLYHITKFMRLGLIEITKEEARKGKAVKYYRTTAKAFFVPFRITPSLSLKHLLGQLDKPADDVFNREMARAMQEVSAEWGLDIFYHKPEGNELSILIRRKDKPANREVTYNPDGPAIVSFAGDLHLDFATAKALQKDLQELIENYQKKQNPKEQLYLYRVGLTPAQDESFEPKD
jgi:hypothetical protein